MQESVREIGLQFRRSDGSRLPVIVNSALGIAPQPGHTVVRTTVFGARDSDAYEHELRLARRREAAARERTERLQRLTEALAATLDERDVADATLRAAMEASVPGPRARGGRIRGRRLVEHSSRGEPRRALSEQLDEGLLRCVEEATGERLGPLGVPLLDRRCVGRCARSTPECPDAYRVAARAGLRRPVAAVAQLVATCAAWEAWASGSPRLR